MRRLLAAVLVVGLMLGVLGGAVVPAHGQTGPRSRSLHGSQLYQGRVNYLVIDVFDDRIQLTIKRMARTRDDLGAFWAPHRKRAPGVLTMRPATTVIGTATLVDGRLVNRTGLLREGLD